MPMTSLTCTSRQARTQRLHWMQASRLTAIATWLRSGARHFDRSRLGKRPASMLLALGDLPELGVRIVRVRRCVRLVGDQQLGDHAARGLGAVGLGLDLHAGRRRADAACGEHALALDLDHADAAVAVRPIAGLRRVAQMRQLDVVAARGAEDRLALADVDLLVVHGEGVGRGRCALAAHLSAARCARRRACRRRWSLPPAAPLWSWP